MYMNTCVYIFICSIRKKVFKLNWTIWLMIYCAEYVNDLTQFILCDAIMYKCDCVQPRIALRMRVCVCICACAHKTIHITLSSCVYEFFDAIHAFIYCQQHYTTTHVVGMLAYAALNIHLLYSLLLLARAARLILPVAEPGFCREITSYVYWKLHI